MMHQINFNSIDYNPNLRCDHNERLTNTKNGRKALQSKEDYCNANLKKIQLRSQNHASIVDHKQKKAVIPEPTPPSNNPTLKNNRKRKTTFNTLSMEGRTCRITCPSFLTPKTTRMNRHRLKTPFDQDEVRKIYEFRSHGSQVYSEPITFLPVEHIMQHFKNNLTKSTSGGHPSNTTSIQSTISTSFLFQ